MGRQVVRIRTRGAEGDAYMERLLKLIPAESIAVYMFLDGVLRSALNGVPLKVWLWIVFGVVLVGNLIYLQVGNKVKVLQYAIMELAFAVWVLCVGGPFALYPWYQPFMGSIALGLFTFLAPAAYKGESPIS